MASPRHGFVDALRGFALLGIIVVNAEFILQPSDHGWAFYDSTTDLATRWFIIAFGQAKIYPLFALLFGYGLSIQINRAQTAGHDLGPRYRRRMTGLVLLGVLHGVLFFPGDILVIYAAVGSLSYRFGRHDTKRLLTIAAWVYGIAALCWVLIGLLDLTNTEATTSLPSTGALQAWQTGSFTDVVGVHAGYWIVTLAILTLVQGPAVFACFLVGIALGRTRLLAEPDQHLDLARRVLRWAPLGFALAGLAAWITLTGTRWETLGFALGFASAPLVGAAYLAILALTIGRSNGAVSRVLQASGRMSLTVYLLESIVLSSLAYGYGLGWFGEVGPAGGALIAVATWITLSAFAVAWMKHARFGPFEWALRSFTYGKTQPLRTLNS